MSWQYVKAFLLRFSVYEHLYMSIWAHICLVFHMYDVAAIIVSLPGHFITPDFHIYVFISHHIWWRWGSHHDIGVLLSCLSESWKYEKHINVCWQCPPFSAKLALVSRNQPFTLYQLWCVPVKTPGTIQSHPPVLRPDQGASAWSCFPSHPNMHSITPGQ